MLGRNKIIDIDIQIIQLKNSQISETPYGWLSVSTCSAQSVETSSLLI